MSYTPLSQNRIICDDGVFDWGKETDFLVKLHESSEKYREKWYNYLKISHYRRKSDEKGNYVRNL